MLSKMEKIFMFISLLNIVYCCTPPFESVGDGCYMSNGDMFVNSYDAATTFCQDQGGYLAVVKSGEENRGIVEHFFGASIVEDKVLLGATTNDGGLFEWVDGSLVRDSFTSWAEGQPSGDGGCMGYSNEHSLQWEDFQCDDYVIAELVVGFVCETSTSSSTTIGPATTPSTSATIPPTTSNGCTDPFVDTGAGCYCLLDQTDDFWTGNNNCITMDAHLAYIFTGEKQLAIEQYLTDTGFTDYIWIGAFDTYGNDTFYWLDGTPVDSGYTNYYSLSGGSHDALGTYYGIDWEWNDISITNAYASLCERDI